MKTTVRFEVTLSVTSQQLPTLIQVVDGYATLVKVVPVEAPNGEPVPTKQKIHTHPPRRGIGTGRDFVLSLLTTSTTAVHADDIAKHLTTKGFAQNSASPVISKLVADGTIIQGPTPRTYTVRR